MQFAIYSSTSDLHVALNSEICTVNEASDEEEPEVIIEKEDLEGIIEDDYEASISEEETEKPVEDEELMEVSNEDRNEEDADNSEHNGNDVTSQETDDLVKWSDLTEKEEREWKVIFVVFLHLQLFVSFKFQDV
jgi:ribonuclease BN (tRNA processing enzyme)